MGGADVSELPNPEACVICLERLIERAIALPCKHDQFDFGCLGTWLNEQPLCPLCKCNVTAVKYDLNKIGGGTIFTLSPPKPSTSSEEFRYRRHHPYRVTRCSRPSSSDRTRLRTEGRLPVSMASEVSAIAFRRRVYRTQIYSLRVGSNRISRYQNLNPASFSASEALITRAKCWIRRELSAFDFLNPNSPTYGRPDRRATNAEFLLEYIVSILKSVDIRGSSGQAETLLTDFLGRENARLFLHELEAYLRSPYEALKDWDAHVQYINPNAGYMADGDSS